jgi:hypothetical protein
VTHVPHSFDEPNDFFLAQHHGQLLRRSHQRQIVAIDVAPGVASFDTRTAVCAHSERDRTDFSFVLRTSMIALSYRLADAEQVSLAIFEPRSLFTDTAATRIVAGYLRNAVDCLEAR